MIITKYSTIVVLKNSSIIIRIVIYQECYSAINNMTNTVLHGEIKTAGGQKIKQ